MCICRMFTRSMTILDSKVISSFVAASASKYVGLIILYYVDEAVYLFWSHRTFYFYFLLDLQVKLRFSSCFTHFPYKMDEVAYTRRY